MADIAELGFKVDDNPLARAEDRLLKLPPAAAKAEAATDKFNKSAAAGTKSVNSLAAGTANATTMLLKFASGIMAAFSIAAIVSFTNAWTDLNSRVEIATGSIGLGISTMERLSDMARVTYSSLEQTAETYLRNATALRELGKTTSETLDYVEAVNNALVVSGAKGQRAESVMNALNKAMALGKLSGDNLNTVLESGGRITEVIAESLGVTTLQLRKLGTEGKITGDVIYKSLTGNLEKLRAEAESMPATIGDAFVLLNNGLMKMIGTFDQARGASSSVAEAIIMVADAMNSGAISVERLLSYAVGLAAVMGGAWVTSFVAANGVTLLLVGSLGLLRAALIRTGIGALVVLAGELVYQLFKVVDGADSVGDAFNRLKKSGIETWERIVSGGQFMYYSLESWANKIAALYLETWTDIQGAFFDMLSNISAATGIAIPGMEGWLDGMIASYRKSAEFAAAGEASAVKARDAWAGMFADKSTMDEIGAGAGQFEALKSQFGIIDKVKTATTELTDAQKKAAEGYAKIVEGANQFIKSQELEAQALGMATQQANALRYAQDLLNKAQEGGKSVTAAQRLELLGLASDMAAAEQATANLTFAYETGKATLGSFFSDMKSELMNGTSLWGSFAQAGINALSSLADKALSMAADGIWDMIFGGLKGALGGGAGGGMSGIGKGIAGAFSGGKLQFASGGYTGDGATDKVAGVVHGQEYVLNAQATQRIGVDTLDALNDNGSMTLKGGNDNAPQITFAPVTTISGLGLSLEEVNQLMRESEERQMNALPDVIQNINNDPRKRRSAS